MAGKRPLFIVLVIAVVAAALGGYFLLFATNHFTEPETITFHNASFLDNCGLEEVAFAGADGYMSIIADHDTRQCWQEDYTLVAAYISYDPAIDVDLDGAVQGAISDIRNNPNIWSADCYAEETTIDGLPARSAECSFAYFRESEAGRAQMRFLLHGNDLYMLQALYPVEGGEAYAQGAEMVMESVRFVGE